MAALDTPNAGNANINPARSAAVVTPNDSSELTNVTRAIKIGNTAGNIVVVMADSKADNSQTVTIPVQAGDLLPIQVRLIKNTGTTASAIIALW